MKYLLDSNIVIKLAMGEGEVLRTRAARCSREDLVTSSVVLAEVLYGSENEKPPPIVQLEALLEEVPVLSFDMDAARAYATLPFKRASYDRLIAAHALSLDLIVVTANIRDFSDIPGLTVENWTR